MDGTSREYAPTGIRRFPIQVLSAESGTVFRRQYHVGVAFSGKDSFYGQHSPERMPVSDELESKWKAWKRLGVLASGDESALFYCSRLPQVRCGIPVIWNQEREKRWVMTASLFDIEPVILTGIEAMRLLILEDRKQNS